MNRTESVYEFGKWVETECIPIIKDVYKFDEFLQTSHIYSDLDGIFFTKRKIYPAQIKAISPRCLHRDISIMSYQYQKYKDIADKNGHYYCFLISSCYNPKYKLDYDLYVFDFKKTDAYKKDRFSVDNGRASYYIKLSQMKCEKGKLPIDFQRELEQKHQTLMKPFIKDYDKWYKSKF